jgi:hypothetical protein
MASNKELAEQAQLLGFELGEEVETEGLRNQELAELVARLRERVQSKNGTPSTEPPPPAPEPTPDTPPIDGAADGSQGGPPPPAPEPTPAQRFEYQIAPGKSLTSPRGMLGPGDEIRATDVADGVKQLDYLVERGYVTKR